MTRSRTFGALLAAMLVLVSACGYDADDNSPVHLADPGKCVPVDVAAAPETAPLLDDAAARFNGSAAAHMRDGTCVIARVQAVDSPVALRELSDGWPDADRLGPAPVAWVPGSTMWGELLDARLADQHRAPMAPNGTPFAHSPLVVALPAEMAHALTASHQPIGWADLEQLAHDPRGWGAYGHPEWGQFRLGQGNPHWSTTGLDVTVALDAVPAAAAGAVHLEQSVVYYSDTTQPYFDNWRRLGTASRARARRYLSAVVTDERSVVAYNTGHEQEDESLTGHASRPAVPLVAIYPKDATIESDNPIIVLDASWSSAAARKGARMFTKFALQRTTQAKVAAAGYRPGSGGAISDLLTRTNGVDGSARSESVAPASPAAIEQALTHWQSIRRRANVLVLFDVSDSMGDAADPGAGAPEDSVPPTKIAEAKAALANALDELAPDDSVGLRIFSTKLANPVSPDWLDVVPQGALATRRTALHRAIDGLTPHQGSPLYTATRSAYDTVARAADPKRINGVLLLTDGYNEDDHNTNVHALLAHLATNPDIRVVTVAFSDQADVTTLEQMAQSTNAWTYDASDTNDLADLLPRAFANF
jgi:Ca-activated chloride channel family protein